jgi:hypothetical protein
LPTPTAALRWSRSASPSPAGRSLRQRPATLLPSAGRHLQRHPGRQRPPAVRRRQRAGGGGTFRPDQPFYAQTFGIYGFDPNGTWYLLFLDDNQNPAAPTGVTITSWSLTFTQEPTTQTDAAGNYSFAGLQPGAYTVAVAGTAVSTDPTQSVSLTAAQPAGAANFAIHPPTGAISGNVAGGGHPLAGAKVYLASQTVNGSTTFAPAESGALAGLGYVAAPLTASALTAQFSDVTVSLDLAYTGAAGPQNLDVALLSPQGQVDFLGPDLIHLRPGQGFNGTFSDSGAAGTVEPVQAFNSGVDVLPYPANASAGPDGTWLLLLADADTGSPVGSSVVTLTSWSITFVNPGPSTTTDANGDYSFTGLAAGNYTVGVAGAVAGPDPQQTATVANGQATTGVNFTITPAPDLVATSFQVAGSPTTWGQTVTVNYTIANRGLGDAGAVDVELRLSNDRQIDGADTLLQTIPIGPLKAGDSTSGSLTVTLPGSVIAPPPGFLLTNPIYLGLVVDPGDTAGERSTADKSNQGLGIDTALVSNAALTTDANAQQQPTIAVDPNNPNHVVVAYMDFDRPTGNGGPAYASVGVQSSADGGRTWSKTALPLPAGFDGAAGYPSVAFDGQGRAYIAFMAAAFSPGLLPPTIFPDGRDDSGQLFRGYGTQANNGIFLSVSGDGGLTWADPIPVVEHTYTAGNPVPFDALPSLAIDTSALVPGDQPNPNYGRLYVTWTRDYPAGQMPGVTNPTAGSDILFASSADGGITWITPGQKVLQTKASPTLSPGGSFAPTLPYIAGTASVVVNVTPGANLSGGALLVQLFAADGTLLSAATTVGTHVASVAAPVAVNQSLRLVVSGTTPATAGNFNVELVRTSASPALRDPVLPADGSGQVGGNSDVISHVAVGPDGSVTVALNRGGRFRVFGSADGGTIFTALGLPFGGDVNVRPPNPLASEDFRNFPVRQILADPARPGTLYALEVVDGAADPNNPGAPNATDGSRVVFARSTDGGNTWFTAFTVGGAVSTSLDDDNGGQPLDLSASQLNQVVTGQAMPTMAVDKDGNLSVIWYSTRRDPANHNLDVFGVVSTDGGQNFSANYRVSTASFDPNAGQFLEGNNEYAFGDGIGLAAVNGIDLAAWTDTRNGNQDIFFAAYPLLPTGPADYPPAPTTPAVPNDRFEPNDSAQIATDLGVVSVPRVFPRLALTPDDNDWFRLTAGANGLTVTVSTGGNPLPQVVTLWDATATTVVATATVAQDASGQPVMQLSFPDAQAGATYLLQVAGVPPNQQVVSYSLTVESLTEDLGTQVHAVRTGTLGAGGRFLYLITPAVAGSLDVTVTTSADLALHQFSPDEKLTELPGGGGQQLSVAVSAGTPVLIGLTAGASSGGAFTLEFSNLDQFETSQSSTLFFPTSGGTPASVAVADLNGDGHPDLVTTNPVVTDTNGNVVNSDSVNVLLNNGDGTFGAARGYDAGPGPTGALPGPIDLVVAPLGNNGANDVAITNYQASTVSALLGNGDGTLRPPRLFNATALPGAIASGYLNGGAALDLAVLQLQPGADGVSHVAVLFGRGDGTFLPPIFLPTTFTSGTGQIVVGDFTGHGKASHLEDIIALGFNQSDIDLFVNQGNGTFIRQVLQAPENVASALAADLNGDGITDLVLGGTNTGNVHVLFGKGAGTFRPAVTHFANADPARTAASVSGLALATITQAGQPNPSPDLVATVLPRLGSGTAQVVLLPATGGGTFGHVRQLALGPFTGPIAAGNLADNGADDVAAAVPGGVEVVYGNKPTITANTSKATARDLGTVVHLVAPTRTIVPQAAEAWFKMKVPTEAVPGAGPEVIDFSALFQYTDGGGLAFEVFGPDGTVLNSGQRFVVTAPQGEELTLRVFSPSGGTGAYTLDIDVRPQVVSVAAPSLLPGGGSVNSVVITLQGDRLDAATAQDPHSYALILLNPDGQQAATFAPATINDAPAVIYNPDANIDVAAGLTYPTAGRQAVTLFFKQALPPGSYLLAVSGNIVAAQYSNPRRGCSLAHPT